MLPSNLSSDEPSGEEYPPLPGYDKQPEPPASAGNAKGGTASKGTANKTSTSTKPPANPTSVVTGNLGGLPGAALKRPDPATTPSSRDVQSAQVPSQGNKGVSDLAAAVPPKKPTRAPVDPDAPAYGKYGGLLRWDNLRERLHGSISPDDPLFTLIFTLEESEASLHESITLSRKQISALLVRFERGLSTLDPLQDSLEQNGNLAADLVGFLMRIEPALVALEERGDAAQESPVLSPPKPSLPPSPTPGIVRRFFIRLGLAAPE